MTPIGNDLIDAQITSDTYLIQKILLQDARAGEKKWVKVFYKQAISTHTPTPEPESALFLLTKLNALNVIKYLQDGIDARELTNNDNRLLSYAIQNETLIISAMQDHSPQRVALTFRKIRKYLYKKGTPASSSILRWAAKIGDVPLVQRCLDQGLSEDISNPVQDSALFLAIQSRSFQVIKLLITSGLYTTELCHRGAFLLEYFIEHLSPSFNFEKTKAIMHLLLEAGVSASPSLLIWAAQKGDAQLVQLCLNQNILVNTTNLTQAPALFLAVQSGSFETIACLINSGADMISKTDTNYSFLNYLVEGWSQLFTLAEIQKLNVLFKSRHHLQNSIIDTYSLEGDCRKERNQNNLLFQDDSCNCLIHNIPLADNPIFFLNLIISDNVGYFEKLDLIKYMLIKTPELVHAKNNQDKTALSLTLERADKKLAEILLFHGADPNYQGDKNRPLLTQFINKIWFFEQDDLHSKQIIDLLLNQPTIKIVPELLLWASLKGDQDLVNLCLKQGIAVDVRQEVHKDLLLEDIDVQQTLGKVLIDDDLTLVYPYVFHQHACWHALDFNQSTPLLLAMNMGHIGIIQILLRYGANPNLLISPGTPVFKYWLNNISSFLSRKKQVSIVSLLLKFVDIQLVPELLLWAAKTGVSHCVAYCLSTGLSANMQDQFKSTALHFATLALYSKGEGLRYRHKKIFRTDWIYWAYLKIMQLLLYQGAFVNHRDIDGKTPLMQAAEREYLFNDMPMTQLLLQWGAEDGHILCASIAEKIKPYTQLIHALVKKRINLDESLWTESNTQKILYARAPLIKFEREHYLLQYTFFNKAIFSNSTQCFKPPMQVMQRRSKRTLPGEIYNLIFSYYWLMQLDDLENCVNESNHQFIVNLFMNNQLIWEHLFEDHSYKARY